MEQKRWKLIQRLYHAARERDGSERTTYLAKACGRDESLRREVDSLLAADRDSGSFLKTPLIEPLGVPTRQETKAFPWNFANHYEVLSQIGEGGMGEVYLARDTSLPRKVALKLLPREFTRDPERIARFRREALAASALNHPNIITIYEIGEAANTHFIAAEYVEGYTLREHMAGDPAPLRELLDMAAQIASALVDAHEAGIVHRDIKPENVMLRPDGYVKVLDFGIAKLVHQISDKFDRKEPNAVTNVDKFTRDGTILGTARYMSPEQIRGCDVDGRSDIFSLGILLYEMVARSAPFHGKTPQDVTAAILTKEVVPLRREHPTIPAELDRILGKALAKDREVRYQVVKDLLIDLRALKLELEVGERLRRGDSGLPATAGRATESITVSDGLPVSTELEVVGGAVPLGSGFYIHRPADHEFHRAISRRDSIVLVKGARQVGKTSLLARALQRARDGGSRIVLTDFQNLGAGHLASVDRLMIALAKSFADQLELDTDPGQMWDADLGPGINLERYLRRGVFKQITTPIVWGLDEVDRLFTCDFGSEVFGLFRSWHNKRALDPDGPWQKLTLAIAYATEAHLLITDLNQSPFNVGTRLSLEDFTLEHVSELNRRYGSVLGSQEEIERYFQLVGGHPYLVRRGFYEMASRGCRLSEIEGSADHDDGPFGDHLRRLSFSLAQDPVLTDAMRHLLKGEPGLNLESFYRLRSAGVLTGDSQKDARPRCQVYATYLRRHL